MSTPASVCRTLMIARPTPRCFAHHVRLQSTQSLSAAISATRNSNGCLPISADRLGPEASEASRSQDVEPPPPPLTSTPTSSCPGFPVVHKRNQPHCDLPSFLSHTARTGLDPKSTYYTGTHYEYTVAAALQPLGFSLQRVGGADDLGIDLLGTWAPVPTTYPCQPHTPRTLRVLLQCKAIGSARPALIRELEGAFAGAPVGWRRRGVLGFLVADQPATKGVRQALARSVWPMGFMACSRKGELRQMLWNRRAVEVEGMVHLGVSLRHGFCGERGEGGLVLTWKGEHLPVLGAGEA